MFFLFFFGGGRVEKVSPQIEYLKFALQLPCADRKLEWVALNRSLHSIRQFFS